MSKTSKLLAAKSKIAATAPKSDPTPEATDNEIGAVVGDSYTKPVLVGSSTLPPLPSEQNAAVAAEAARVATVAQVPAPIVHAHGNSTSAPVRVSTGSRSKYSDLGIIHVMVTNPKRPGTAGYARFACYAVGMTVAQYKADRRVGKFAAADLNWDLSRGFIAIQEPGMPAPVRKTAAVEAAAPAAAPEPAVEAAAPETAGSGEVTWDGGEAPAATGDVAQMAAD